jgi:hypothetical protein
MIATKMASFDLIRPFSAVFVALALIAWIIVSMALLLELPVIDSLHGKNGG